MASTLFVCVKCLGNMRIVGYVPPDFDNVCEDCSGRRPKAEAEARVSEAVVAGASKPRATRGNTTRKAAK